MLGSLRTAVSGPGLTGVSLPAPTGTAITAPLDIFSTNFGTMTLTASVTITASAIKSPGATAWFSFIANGTSTVSFSGMQPEGGTQTYNNTPGATNQVRIRWDGSVVWYRVTAPPYSLPILNAVSLTWLRNGASTLTAPNILGSNNATTFSGLALSNQQIAANKDFELIGWGGSLQLIGLNNANTLETFETWEHYLWNTGTSLYSGELGASLNSTWAIGSAAAFYKLERISGTVSGSYRLSATDPWTPIRTWSGLNQSAYRVAVGATGNSTMQILSLRVQP